MNFVQKKLLNDLKAAIENAGGWLEPVKSVNGNGWLLYTKSANGNEIPVNVDALICLPDHALPFTIPGHFYTEFFLEITNMQIYAIKCHDIKPAAIDYSVLCQDRNRPNVAEFMLDIENFGKFTIGIESDMGTQSRLDILEYIKKCFILRELN